tara:strand:- start:841 stop:1569 length:729 start_codon:yes stop_codon:yes gene_type:complete
MIEIENLEEYFSEKLDYEEKNKKKMREAYKSNKIYIPRCIFCNEKGGTLFETTPEYFKISCKEKKCSEEKIYTRKKKINIVKKIKILENELNDIRDNIIELHNLEKNKIKNIDMNELNKYETKMNNIELKKNEMEEQEETSKINRVSHINELRLFKKKLIDDLREHNLKDIINYDAIVEINENIKKVDEELNNVIYQVRYVEDNIDYGNPPIKDGYYCKNEDTYNLILNENCIESNEIDLDN